MDGRKALAEAFDHWYTASGLSQIDVAASGGPSTTTQTKVRQTHDPISRQTLKQIDAVTGWGTGMASRILSGELAGPPAPIARTVAPLTDAELIQILGRRLGVNVMIDDEPADREMPTSR